MKRENLHDSALRQLGRIVNQAQGQAAAAHTRPAGQTVLREGSDITWSDGSGDPVSIKSLPASMQSVIEVRLAEGLATEGRRNTVSTQDPPTDVTGYPADAWWSKVSSTSDMTVSAVWQLDGGAWVSRDIPDGGLVRSWADIGLLQVSVLAAKLITSGFFRTAVDGQRVEIDLNGPRVVDEAGVITELTVVRTEMGDEQFSGLRVRNPQGDVATVGMTRGQLRQARKVGTKVAYTDLSDEEFRVAFYDEDDGPYGGSLIATPTNFSMSDPAGNGFTLWDRVASFGYGNGKIRADSDGMKLTGVTHINGAAPVLATRKVTPGVGLQGGGMLGEDLTLSIAPAASPVTAQTVTSGALADLGLGFWSIKHTTTPNSAWGMLHCYQAGDQLVQRFQGDNTDRTIYERRRSGSGSWTGWDVFMPATVQTLAGALTAKPGWDLSEISLLRTGNMGQVSFVAKPNSNRAAGEHQVASANGALNAHIRAGLNRVAGVWQSVYGDGQGGSIAWDRPSGIFFLHNRDGAAGGIGHAVQINFIIG